MASNELETSIRQLERTIKPNESQIASFNTQLECLQRTVDQIIKAAALAAELDDQESLSKLDEAIKELLVKKEHLSIHKKAIQYVAKETSTVLRTQQELNVVSLYEEFIREREKTFEEKTEFEKFGSLGEYIEFRKTIWREQHLDGAEFPSMHTFFRDAGQADEENDSDDDLVVSAATMNVRCPLTLQPIEHPMLSKKCQHFYEKEAILSLMGNGCICPVVGCNVKLKRKDLVEDELLERRIRRARDLEASQLDSMNVVH
ncbi:Smc5-6 complex non-SMC subunit 2 [Schizosaccharomyces japonicus yFS275]|uniref:Smc5-6 complex non-SMC subunit 2 n=1 Tax=Schizosaccharomyces japonicus (strain yFS275 / FY16936) TaxID=402676 RepID=B6JYV5_SCHJY|nr:Smc5-6 complex non-SMC subunit 2 [Schizosaccharomyces japonicus yFS275]EEB06723.1 Smc5-6 complex non-SMC subunit 2 [Schizosaccharomyces japonicus yFS275]